MQRSDLAKAITDLYSEGEAAQGKGAILDQTGAWTLASLLRELIEEGKRPEVEDASEWPELIDREFDATNLLTFNYPDEESVAEYSHAITRIILGNGTEVLYWNDLENGFSMDIGFRPGGDPSIYAKVLDVLACLIFEGYDPPGEFCYDERIINPDELKALLWKLFGFWFKVHSGSDADTTGEKAFESFFAAGGLGDSLYDKGEEDEEEEREVDDSQSDGIDTLPVPM
jgi:hypothetical protein